MENRTEQLHVYDKQYSFLSEGGILLPVFLGSDPSSEWDYITFWGDSRDSLPHWDTQLVGDVEESVALESFEWDSVHGDV